jgi:ornithine cyclodeaminase/alanine dehydrogenase-like protein (mu-crystallin family)
MYRNGPAQPTQEQEFMDDRYAAPPPLFISRADVGRAVTFPEAVGRLEGFLLEGFDPERDGLRSRLDTQRGQLLQMPSTSGDYTGTKLLTISPDNAAAGAPVIQGLYALFGGPDQRPLAVIDGAALTNLRTPAVSAMGALRLAPAGPKRLLVFGTGPQAWEHLRAFNSVFDLTSAGIVGRNPESAARLAARACDMGLDTSVAGTDAVADADIIVCCTGAAEPLFDGSLVKETAVVVAIGSHEPNRRELDDCLMSRASIYVESLSSSQREAGDVLKALASGAIAGPERLNTLTDLVRGRKPRPAGRPAVFKTTGMPWQDLALAAAVYEIYSAGASGSASAWGLPRVREEPPIP